MLNPTENKINPSYNTECISTIIDKINKGKQKLFETNNIIE